MAKFTCSVPLNIAWFGNDLIGTSSTTYRIPDALYDEFLAKVVPTIKGTVTWVDTDEVATIGTPQHSALLGVTANQHHGQVHAIGGADHSGTLAHSALGSVGANDHHSQVHSIGGADHTSTLTTTLHGALAGPASAHRHSDMASIGANDHHNQAHDIAGSDHTGSMTFAQLPAFTIGSVAATAALTLSTTFTDVPGLSYSATPSRAETWVVLAVGDFDASVAGTNVGIGQIVIDTTTQAPSLLSTGKTVQRSTVAQTYVIAVSAAAHTVKMQASKTVADGTHVVNASHSTLVIIRLPA